MTVAKRGIAAIAAVVSAAGLATVASAPAGAAGPAIKAEVVRMSARSIHVSSKSIHAGTVEFTVLSTDQHVHQLQVFRLHKGYSLRQAGSDLPKAFRGNVKAIRRVDHRITFRGGAAARPHKPGAFALDLAAGRYTLFDVDGNAIASLRVHGKASSHPTVPHQGQITTFTYGFGVDGKLAAKGSVRLRDVSDQPHFVQIQRVKESTTRRQVSRFVRSGGRGKPSWMLHGGTGTGVMSPNRHQVVSYDLPAGKYLLACFWPDDETGMPHFFMGMWKLVHLGE
jgi:hypothetical protein